MLLNERHVGVAALPLSERRVGIVGCVVPLSERHAGIASVLCPSLRGMLVLRVSMRGICMLVWLQLSMRGIVC